MSFDMMSYLRQAWNWFGGGEAKDGTRVDAGITAGAGTGSGTVAPGSSIAADVLGGMVGGFEQPMNWKGAGFGGVAGGQVMDKDGAYVGGYAGAGAGAGYSTFSGTDSKGYDMSGGAIAGGAVAPIGGYAGTSDLGIYGGTNVYTGRGASAYEFDNGKGDTGYGAKASAVPLGLMDTNLGFKTGVVDYDAHVDNAYLNKASGDVKFGNDNGKYYADANAAYQAGVEGLKTSTATPLGTIGSHGDKITYGPSASLGGSYDSKTGAAELHGIYQDGINAKNVGVDYKGGPIDAGVQGDVAYGNAGQGYATWDPTTNTAKAGVKDGHTGGVRVTDATGHVKVGDAVDVNAKLGEFSNDVQFSGYTEVDADHAKVAGSVDGGGFRISKAEVDGTFGSGDHKVQAGAKVGQFGTTNSINDAYLEADWQNGRVNAGFDKLSYGGISASDVDAHLDGPYGINAKAHMGYFNQGLTMDTGKVTVDENGYAASLKNATYADVAIKDANYDVNLGGAYHADAKLGELGTNHTIVDRAVAGLTKDKGLYAGAKEARYDSLYLQGVEANQAIGGDLYKSHLGLGEGVYNSFSGKNIYAGLGPDGAKAHLEDGAYRYLGGKDIAASTDLLGGNLGAGIGAKEASAGGVDVGYLDFQADLEKSHLAAKDLGAHGFKSKDLAARANIGALGADAGAKELNLLDARVAAANLDTSNYGTTGAASVKGANMDLVNAKGAHAGLAWGDQQLVGATADFRNGYGVDSADANWDLASGQAGAKFKNANTSAQLSNASVDLFGYDIALPDAGYKLNASGDAGVDLSHGAAHAQLGLGGSSVNFGGYELEIPDWVQAGAGVDLSRGAVNAQLGGENGIGADISIADGNFDLNAFGYTLDVDGGIRDAGNAIADGAGWVYDQLPSLPSISLPSISLPSLW